MRAVLNSHIKSLRIVLKPAQPIFEGGLKVGDTQGKYAQFVEGKFETKDEETIEKLKSLPTFNVDFWEVTDEASESKDDQPKAEGDLTKLTKKELQAMATEKGIDLDGSETKDRLIELLQQE